MRHGVTALGDRNFLDGADKALVWCEPCALRELQLTVILLLAMSGGLGYLC